MGFGGLYYVLDGARSWPGPLLALLGTTLSIIVVCAGAGGVVMLCACLALLVAVALMFGAALKSRRLATVGWVACAMQIGVLGLSHPIVAGGTGWPWSPVWTTWCAVASLLSLQLGWLSLLASRGRLVKLTPSWIGAGLRALAVVLAGTVGSTVLSLLLSWPPLLTLIWATCAAVCLRLRRTARWLSLVAGLAALASLVKLIGWDWPQLGIAGRFELLLGVGTVLLVSPLLARPFARHQELSRMMDADR